MRSIEKELFKDENAGCEYISIKFGETQDILRVVNFCNHMRRKLEHIEFFAFDDEEILIAVPRICGVGLEYSMKELLATVRFAMDRSKWIRENCRGDDCISVTRFLLDRTIDDYFERIVTDKYEVT